MKMHNTKFSIIMPAYNAEKYIGEAIESVLAQTYTKWQLVIVDDGSRDRTLEIAQQYEKEDEVNGSRIIVIHQENSGTAAAARNTALKYVTGDYIQMLDSDDYISSDMFEKYRKAIDEMETIPTIISPIALSVTDQGKMQREISHVSQYVGQIIDGNKAFELSLDWTIHGWVCVRTDLMKKIQFDPLLVNGDEFTTRKILANAQRVTFVDATYFYRDNLESTTKSAANRSRMYEALITDGNIYKYSVEEHMQESAQLLCAQKWDKSIIAHRAQLMREGKTYDNAEYEYAYAIICRNLEDNYILQVAERDSSVYGKLIRWCNAKEKRLVIIANIYNFIWRILKYE